MQPQTQGEEPVIADKTLDLLLREYVELWNDGSSMEEIAAEVRHYPLVPPIRTAGHLSALVQRVVKAGEPLWFRKWWDEERIVNRNTVASRPCPPPSRPLQLVAPEHAREVALPESEPELPAPASEPEAAPEAIVEPEPVAAVDPASTPLIQPRSLQRRTTMKGSVTAEDMPKFCDDFKALFIRGVSTADMMPKLRRYFKNPDIPLKNPSQIYNLTRVIAEDGRAPDSFKTWFEHRNDVARPVVRTAAKKKEPVMAAPKQVAAHTNGAAKSNGHTNGAANGAPPPAAGAHASGREGVREVSAALDVLRRHEVLDHASAWKMLMDFVG